MPIAVEPPPASCGIKGICPRCGARTLYDGLLAFAPRCTACGLDFSGFNVGDGPAAFLTTIIGTLVCIGAIALALTVNPPLWVHALLWVPIATVATIGSLRVTKGWLLALEYRNAAREGRIAGNEP
ncbi:DUF983 domain-containing protein [Sphingomonas naphthae]|uniref:DUF983 domain-containing protein n=1 Tax=Sphingomonas naphthae TaxID=1813468 RepID=A0ABY7TMH9_9SPHN|nr:DUF983 domain-containing protein [Sphingomonas naphthae]WCT73439.1 DUF983 domain-containing protein [Sphingomonas naphthae]